MGDPALHSQEETSPMWMWIPSKKALKHFSSHNFFQVQIAYMIAAEINAERMAVIGVCSTHLSSWEYSKYRGKNTSLSSWEIIAQGMLLEPTFWQGDLSACLCTLYSLSLNLKSWGGDWAKPLHFSGWGERKQSVHKYAAMEGSSCLDEDKTTTSRNVGCCNNPRSMFSHHFKPPSLHECLSHLDALSSRYEFVSCPHFSHPLMPIVRAQSVYVEEICIAWLPVLSGGLMVALPW